MKLKIDSTERGFARAEFKDRKGEECSIQKSSVATEDCLWLGQNTGTHHMGECMSRMHLTRKQVAALLPLLQCFVETGELT
jgi:hypothetical protein